MLEMVRELALRIALVNGKRVPPYPYCQVPKRARI